MAKTESQKAGRLARVPDARKAIASWLFVCCALIFAMVVLGGVTRLTQSGLSMVDWRPLLGVLPPSGESEWLEVFHRYQQFPEYQKLKLGMTLAQFKEIYWMEYAHRMLGRAIAVAFLLPFVYFLATRRIGRKLAPWLAGIFALGALQGLLGWYMVKSGLIADPDVSPYRLAAHLGLAAAIYGVIFWLALGLISPRGPDGQGRRLRALRCFAQAAAGLIFIALLSGGLVAGNDAGLAYNTFPLMDGRLFPRDYFLLEPAWRNAFENIPAVQFDHRVFAVTLVATIAMLWVVALKTGLPPRARLAFSLLFGMVLVQAGLGVATLLTYVPVPLASLHQAGALLLLTLALWVNHELYRGPAPKGPSRIARTAPQPAAPITTPGRASPRAG